MMRASVENAQGFTLIELMVGIAVFAILVIMGLPTYATFIQNSEIRAAAESVENGLQLARAEAVRRNDDIQLQLLNTLDGNTVAGGTDWSVRASTVAAPTVFNQVVQTRLEARPASAARIGVAATVSPTAAAAGAGLPAAITFTGAGRLSTASTVRQIDITGTPAARRLSIQLSPAGDIRLCDPALSLAANPQGCS